MNPTTPKTTNVPSLIYAEAFVRSKSGDAVVDAQEIITAQNISRFDSDANLINVAIEQLQQAGFDVYPTPEQLQDIPNLKTITIAAPPDVYERVFNIKLTAMKEEFGKVAKKVVRHDSGNLQFIDPSQSELRQVLEGIMLNDPISHFATTPSPFPPPTPKWCLHVPVDVALGMNAALAHRAGFTGRHIRVVMIDSGWYPHPFFLRQGYRARVVLAPGAGEDESDESGKLFKDKSGHGTGESANLFAIAPDIEFIMIKQDPGAVNMPAALKMAIGLKPDIISCSWGRSIPVQPPLNTPAGQDILMQRRSYEIPIAEAVKQGIIVVFSAGNLVQQEDGSQLGQWAFPGQHPDVIAAGGAFMYPDERLAATQFASGFISKIYKNHDDSPRVVPDVCGLVGLPSDLEPSLGGLYIMLPVEPGCDLDKHLADDPTTPLRDDTLPADGWAIFSGTSAAAPQIAGICALMKQAYPELSPGQAKDILQKTARDVIQGGSAPMIQTYWGERLGYMASEGHDIATGFGLADATRATLLARLYHLSQTASIPSEVQSPAGSLMAGQPVTEADWQALEKAIL